MSNFLASAIWGCRLHKQLLNTAKLLQTNCYIYHTFTIHEKYVDFLFEFSFCDTHHKALVGHSHIYDNLSCRLIILIWSHHSEIYSAFYTGVTGHAFVQNFKSFLNPAQCNIQPVGKNQSCFQNVDRIFHCIDVHHVI